MSPPVFDLAAAEPQTTVTAGPRILPHISGEFKKIKIKNYIYYSYPFL